jgi:hypothetical protein
MSAAAIGSSQLRAVLERAAEATGLPLKDLTVLARQNDPFLLDTAAGHRDAEWFLEQAQRLVPHGAIHLRGLHYRIVATADVLKPNGMPYTNTDEDWIWLQNKPAKAGRWLGYVDFARVVDERNAPPEIYEAQPVFTPYGYLSVGCGIEAPSEDNVLPYVGCASPAGQQPYGIILIGEKVSLGPILKSMRGIAEVLLPTGELTDTMIYGMAQRANADGRQAVVLYCSDFDPSGHQMPISVSRKLQALQVMCFPELRIEVHPVALTLEQVVSLDLPSTPLKETERRADRWRAVMGREQTEIDALAALRPDVLRQIVVHAIAPFYDASLHRRAEAARSEWQAVASEALRSHPLYEASCDAIRYARDGVEAAIANLRRTQAQAEADLRMALPRIDRIEAELGETPIPLFSTGYDFATASRRLIDHKKLNGAGEE